MVTFEESLTEEIFDALKEQESRNYLNNFLKPSKLSRDLRLAILLQSHWTNVDKHTMCHKIGLQMMKSFSKQLLEQLYIQSLVQGNVLEQDALDACSNIVHILKFGLLLPNSRPQMRVVQVPLGEIYSRIPSFNEEDSNSLITNYYQSEPGSIKITCIIELLMIPTSIPYSPPSRHPLLLPCPQIAPLPSSQSPPPALICTISSPHPVLLPPFSHVSILRKSSCRSLGPRRFFVSSSWLSTTLSSRVGHFVVYHFACSQEEQ
uniref:Uncharacterized protein n=1 Tax=Timema tahoe TaxID=61484 RepID=A0A7R9NYU6_9NEOP|nr:unnamed protein product [Timema tahoe]